MEAIPEGQFFPSLESAMGGASGSAHIERNDFPATARHENEPENPQNDPMGRGQASTERADRLLVRQMVADKFVKLIRHAGLGHVGRLQ